MDIKKIWDLQHEICNQQIEKINIIIENARSKKQEHWEIENLLDEDGELLTSTSVHCMT